MQYTPPVREYLFLHDEVFGGAPAARDFSREDFVAVLQGLAQLAGDRIFPAAHQADQIGTYLRPDGIVETPPEFARLYDSYVEGGWAALGVPEALGGMGLPEIAMTAKMELFGAANIAFDMYIGWGECAATMFGEFGSEQLQNIWLPKLVSGEWSGAMALTEPQCGTDLGLVKTQALRRDDGTFAITGNKIFITGGDHELSQNIIHFVLARIEGAAPGPRGLSLFIVPKHLVDESGQKTGRNSVQCIGLERKMGVHASATCALRYEAATGWLLGAPGQGLEIMFRLMNHMRRRTGAIAVGTADLAGQLAAAYVKERRQGRAPGPRNGGEQADVLLVHPDVRRTLVEIGAFSDAGRALLYYSATLTEAAQAGDVAAETRINLLTPVVKAVLSDMGFAACVEAQQIHGGHGFVCDTGIERLVRDTRVLQIAEGANGIQAIDLTLRKVLGDNGAAFSALLAEIEADIAALPVQDSIMAQTMTRAVADWKSATLTLLAARNDFEVVALAATDYLRLTGLIVLGWMWVRIAPAARRSRDKDWRAMKAARATCFANRILPETTTRRSRIESDVREIMTLSETAF